MVMFNLFAKPGEEKELKRLESRLFSLEKPSLTAVQKRDLRLSLMKSVKSGRQGELLPSALRNLGFKINRIANSVKMPAWVVFSMKERILQVVEDRGNYEFDNNWFRAGNLLRTAISGALLLIFVVTSILVFPFSAPTSYARLTYFDDVSGDVYVLRDGAFLQAKSSFALQEGDVVMTNNQGTASVHFFDDSLSRLGENTNLEIKRLYSEPLNPVATDVELYLNKGKVWNKVVNLTDDSSSFTVETNRVSASVVKKAVFDVTIDKNDTKIAVFDNVVNLVTTNNIENSSKTVVAGFQAQLEHQTGAEIQLESISNTGVDPNDGKKWVAANLESDLEYDKKLGEQKEKIFSTELPVSGSTNAEVISAGNTFNTSEKFNAARDAFLEAYGVLTKAETMLARGNRAEAKSLLYAFRSKTVLVLSQMDELIAAGDPNAVLLESLINEKISSQKKDLATFLPDNALYEAKKMISEVELIAASSDVKKIQIELSQAEGKLLEFQALLKMNKYDYAMRVFRDYKLMSLGFSIKIDRDNLAELQDNLADIVKNQIQQIKVLTALEQTLITQGQAGYRDEVEMARQNLLKKLVDSMAKLPDTLPSEIVYDLKDMFQSYLADKTEDAKFILPVLDTLVSGDKQLKFIMPGENSIPDDIGVVVIEDQAGTPEVSTLMKAIR